MDLIRAGVIQPGQVLQFGGRANTQAHVTPSGTVMFQGVEYNSPSTAAMAVTKNSVNGWKTWRVKVDDNGWVKISDLRNRI
jgi:hypothetical protein